MNVDAFLCVYFLKCNLVLVWGETIGLKTNHETSEWRTVACETIIMDISAAQQQSKYAIYNLRKHK